MPANAIFSRQEKDALRQHLANRIYPIEIDITDKLARFTARSIDTAIKKIAAEAKVSINKTILFDKYVITNIADQGKTHGGARDGTGVPVDREQRISEAVAKFAGIRFGKDLPYVPQWWYIQAAREIKPTPGVFPGAPPGNVAAIVNRTLEMWSEIDPDGYRIAYDDGWLEKPLKNYPGPWIAYMREWVVRNKIADFTPRHNV
jgi:hypothetical protein